MVHGVRLVARGGSVVEVTCDGFADVAAGRPWTRRTRSQIASISKQFAAALTLILVAEGALALSDPVSGFLPGTPGQWRDVTVEHLLTHTSGMSHWNDLPGFDPSRAVDPAERLGQLLAAPLSGSPGTSWGYSSPGYIVLRAVLEKAAPADYADLVRSLILAPLGLNDTSVGHAATDDAATGYRDGEPVTPWRLHDMPGTGDIWSTADDVARFLAALHGGSLLPERVQPVLHAVTASGYPTSDPTGPVVIDGYGLGHFRGTINGQPALLHPGDNPGYLSLAAWIPETDTVVVALSNDESDDLDEAVASALTTRRMS